jgi:hypothetical protein
MQCHQAKAAHLSRAFVQQLQDIVQSLHKSQRRSSLSAWLELSGLFRYFSVQQNKQQNAGVSAAHVAVQEAARPTEWQLWQEFAPHEYSSSSTYLRS